MSEDVENVDMMESGFWIKPGMVVEKDGRREEREQKVDELLFETNFKMAVCEYSNPNISNAYEYWLAQLAKQDEGVLSNLRLKMRESVDSFIVVTDIMSALATDKDRAILIEMLQESSDKGGDYLSPTTDILRTLNNLNVSARIEGKDLSDTYDELKILYDSVFPYPDIKERFLPLSREELWAAMAITGDVRAKEFLKEEMDNVENHWFNEILFSGNPREVPEYILERNKLEWTGQENEFIRDLSARECVEKVVMAKESLEQSEIKIEGVYKKIAELYLFNELVEKGTQADLVMALEKVQRWMEQEQETKDNIYLPPEGVELEVPQKERDKYRVIMEWFEISNVDEGTDLFEINDAPTYSAIFQARLLHELTRVGVVNKINLEDADKKEVGSDETFSREKLSEDVLSLHVNLGIPKEIDALYAEKGGDVLKTVFVGLAKGEFRPRLEVMTGLLAFAFVSPSRAENKKQNDSWRIQSGDEDVVQMDKSGCARLELRISEFRDFPTYRMMSEIQLLSVAMFAKIRKNKGEKLEDEALRSVAEMWEKAEDEFKKMMRKYGVVEDMNTILDSNKGTNERKKLVEYLKNDNLKKEARELVTKMAKKLKQKLEGKKRKTPQDAGLGVLS